MNRLAYVLVSLPLLLTLLGGVEAGPACARRSQGTDDCVKKCADKWGWPGYAMGTDRWGSVITQTATSSEALVAAVTKACRVRSSSASSSTTASAQPTVAPANVQGSASLSSVVSLVTPVSSALSPTLLISSQVSSTHSSISKPAAFTHSSARPLITSSAPPEPSTTTSSSTRSTTPTTSEKPTTSSTHTTPHTTNTPSTTSTPHTTTSEAPKTTVVKTTSQAAAQPSSPAGSDQSSSTSQSDINAYLSAHNTIRAQHGAADLTWSDDLAAAAQTWANKCVFKHSGGSLGPFGENLAAGTGSAYGIAAAVKSWTDEVSEYDPNNPQPSHFTQVVWKATKQVGCAVQECSGIFDPSFGLAKFYVCEYSPAGNVIGQFPQNVQV